MTTTTTTKRRGVGRPYIGDIVEVRLPRDVIERYEAQAERDEVKRAELMRAVLMEHAPPKRRRGRVDRATA